MLNRPMIGDRLKQRKITKVLIRQMFIQGFDFIRNVAEAGRNSYGSLYKFARKDTRLWLYPQGEKPNLNILRASSFSEERHGNVREVLCRKMLRRYLISFTTSSSSGVLQERWESPRLRCCPKTFTIRTGMMSNQRPSALGNNIRSRAPLPPDKPLESNKPRRLTYSVEGIINRALETRPGAIIIHAKPTPNIQELQPFKPIFRIWIDSSRLLSRHL